MSPTSVSVSFRIPVQRSRRSGRICIRLGRPTYLPVRSASCRGAAFRAATCPGRRVRRHQADRLGHALVGRADAGWAGNGAPAAHRSATVGKAKRVQMAPLLRSRSITSPVEQRRKSRRMKCCCPRRRAPVTSECQCPTARSMFEQYFEDAYGGVERRPRRASRFAVPAAIGELLADSGRCALDVLAEIGRRAPPTCPLIQGWSLAFERRALHVHSGGADPRHVTRSRTRPTARRTCRWRAQSPCLHRTQDVHRRSCSRG